MKQAERDELLIRLDEKIQDIYKDTKTIKRTLYGNGQEGLVYVVNRHKTFFMLIGAALTLIVGVLMKIMI